MSTDRAVIGALETCMEQKTGFVGVLPFTHLGEPGALRFAIRAPATDEDAAWDELDAHVNDDRALFNAVSGREPDEHNGDDLLDSIDVTFGIPMLFRCL